MAPRRRETFHITVHNTDAEEILLQRLKPLLRACVWSDNFTNSLMLSCYLQGAVDGNTQAVQKKLALIRGGRGGQAPRR